jgi:hypothetical protein
LSLKDIYADIPAVPAEFKELFQGVQRAILHCLDISAYPDILYKAVFPEHFIFEITLQFLLRREAM